MKNINLKSKNVQGKSINPNLNGKVNDVIKLETDMNQKNDFGASEIAVALISTFGPIIYSKIKDKISKKDLLIQVINSCRIDSKGKNLYFIQIKITNVSDSGIYFDKIIINDIIGSSLGKYQLKQLKYYYELDNSKRELAFGNVNINESIESKLKNDFQNSVYCETSSTHGHKSKLINIYLDLSKIIISENIKIAKINFIYSKLDENIKSEEISVLLRL